ncbi:hypothetical protein JCGZ_16754 [Jatropha curcas]|uniref:Uncharacterized protein n=1 Tax=Jatropha curcas TaxID=180498 RepID=A0A067L4W4_JATCU|nr:uncharacterized protein LOC105628694 [Jatropha curcas]KDP43467.1 hypothetical protein JCGZ_16754 [Jatropha curcas]
MEPAKIDWKKVESIFVEDNLYENLNAPKWVDFLNPEDNSVDDEAWFCRPECNHPKSVEDFLRTTPTSKLPCSAEKSKTPLGNWNLRDAKSKRRGQSQSSFTFGEDSENRNPNLSTPPNYQAKFLKGIIKSSTEKKKPVDDISQTNEAPRLKSTLSARNLFAGKDILGHISEFCNELKKMAMRAREGENDERDSQVGEKKDVAVVTDCPRKVSGNVKEGKERKPLLEVGREKSEGIEKGSVKEKLRKKKIIDDAENIPVPLNLENVKHKGEERLLQIRTNPPSPQCFSATRPPTKTTPSKASKSRLMERGILQEVKQNKEVTEEETENKGRSFSIVDGRETRPLDVFWFLKPCTLSS